MPTAGQDKAGLVDVVVARVVWTLDGDAVLDGDARGGTHVLGTVADCLVHGSGSVGARRVGLERDAHVGKR